MCTRIFLVFSLSRCSFATVPAGIECNIESPVMVSNWVSREYSYAVWNGCVPALSVQLCTVFSGMEYNRVGPSYGLALGVLQVNTFLTG